MSISIFSFGERRPEYSVPVLNERAVRAGAGILFFFALIAFMNAWLTGNFAPTRVFVVAFLFDFVLRLFVNPALAPSLVLGQWMVRRQQPEWVGAPPKRFAWGIGLVLAFLMLYLVVIRQVVGPVNLLVCSVCLLLLFFETAFGICIGCWIHSRIYPGQAALCPGGVCDPGQRAVLHPPKVGFLAVVAMVGLVIAMASQQPPNVRIGQPVTVTSDAVVLPNAADAERCKVPEFAKAMGHEQKWKLHNNCP
ncbi:MAG: DUF4395 domain-containing protein [Rhodoferax sp.]|nr:MAG: DUF4395 domain-containing protein [Rhodoferax sp.]